MVTSDCAYKCFLSIITNIDSSNCMNEYEIEETKSEILCPDL